MSNSQANWNLELLVRGADGEKYKATTFLDTPFAESGAQISPDGRYVAYCSDESGQTEVWVREFPSAAGRLQISEQGGCQPRWSHSSSELYFVSGDTLMAVEFTTSQSLRIGRPKRLFAEPTLRRGTFGWQYDVSRDGRFVITDEVEDSEAGHRRAIRVTQNWYEEFRDRD